MVNVYFVHILIEINSKFINILPKCTFAESDN